MSDMAKSFARAKLAALPPEPPLREDAEDDQYSSASSVSSTGTVRASESNKKKEPVAKLTPSGWQSFGDLSNAPFPNWTDLFQQAIYLDHSTDTNTAQYRAFVVEPNREPGTSGIQHPIIVLHHGAGSSALSFGLFVGELRRLLPDSGIIAVEARNHGESIVRTKSGEVDHDMSIDTLSSDLALMVRLTVVKLKWAKAGEDGEVELPSMLLVGHSLGGAVVTHAAYTSALGNLNKSGKRINSNVIGFCVIDAVEGSAVDALKHMRAYLAKRPSSFDSIEDAVDWHIRSKTLRNIDSAWVSVPSIIELDVADGKWLWKTDLSHTEEYWSNWFTGMSNKFLSAMGAKLLLLAGTDRLDKEMTIGQMQGKFQLQVIPEAGHFVQEDCPERTASIIAEFFKRNDRSALVLPPKVSDLLAQGVKV